MYFCYNFDNKVNSPSIVLTQYDYDVWSLLKLHLKKLDNGLCIGKTKFSFKQFPQYDLVINDIWVINGHKIVEVVFEDISISNTVFYVNMNCDESSEIVNTVLERKTIDGKKTRFILSDCSELSNTNGYGNILAYNICKDKLCNEYPINFFN